jgi:hypothetical protein
MHGVFRRFVFSFAWCLRLMTVVAVLALPAAPPAVITARAAPSGCRLNSADGAIQHVIYLQFDNVHFRRDNPNVPSELEQMPSLLNFITRNGTLITNDHTVLGANTASGILSSLTGVYPDRMGQPIANSFRYFTPAGTSRTGVSFAYWTAPLFDPAPGPTDFTPEMINENGKIAPAPWVPFTRAGCDVGSVATANTILENTAIDIPTVFGAGSPEAGEVASTPGQAFADFVGIGIHCAPGSSLCAPENHGRPDLLPDEPGGYAGFRGVFGAKYVDPLINPDGPLRDLDGNIIQDASGHIGFPGFDGMEPVVSLAWVAAMQEHGIPVTYAYLSDAHDGHGTAGSIHFAFAPGEAAYVAQLRAYDRAFAQFFARLAADGITKDNTLFVITTDEGDHFIGDPPTPAGCDGVTTPCTYNRVGEISANLRGLVATQSTITTAPFLIHADSGASVYVTGNPARTSQLARDIERAAARLIATNPYTSKVDTVAVALADPVEERTLHMVTADPFRTPTFMFFGDANYFFFAGAPNCASPCVTISPRGPNSFAWNHGDIQPEIASTWVGYVGPGVRTLGTVDVWTDHTDLRPTILTLLGLHDDYGHDGRVVIDLLSPRAAPQTLRAHRAMLTQLGEVYKQLNASFGAFAMDTLTASTKALASDAVGDATYIAIENKILSLTDRRDELASQMKALLDAAAFGGQENQGQAGQGSAQGHENDEGRVAQLIAQGQELLGQAHDLAVR